MIKSQKIILLAGFVSVFDAITTFITLFFGVGYEANPVFSSLNNSNYFIQLIVLGSIKPILCFILVYLLGVMNKHIETKKISVPAVLSKKWLILYNGVPFLVTFVLVEQIIVVSWNAFWIITLKIIV